MSRFRQSRSSQRPEEAAPILQQPAANLVPMSAEDFARIQRRKVLTWGSLGLVAAVLLGTFLYRFSLPAEAQDSYIDAKKLFDSGKYADALSAVSRATRDSRQQVPALQLRAAIYQALHQPEDALADISKVIQIQPNVAANYRERAQMYMDAGHDEKALEDYTKVIEMENSSAAYNGRGICYIRLKRPQRAIEDFTNAIMRQPLMESYLQRGLALASIGEHAKAIADFDRAIEMAPTVSATYRARASSLASMGNLKAAERDRAKALTFETPEQPVLEQVVVPERQ